MTCAEEVGRRCTGLPSTVSRFSRISCIQLLRNVRQLRKQNKTSTETSPKKTNSK